jgi:hypothetical protein
MPERITARVSMVEDFRWWSQSGLEWDWFLSKDRGENERMAAGTALHAWMEKASAGEFDEGRVGDYIFVFDCDAALNLVKVKEQRSFRDYGDLRVTGKVDAIEGGRITDYKLIINHQVEGEQYMDSYQWRYYLDIFGAHAFDYVIFEAHQEADDIFRIKDVHKITQYRYPELHQDCANLAAEFLAAAQQSQELRSIASVGLEDIRGTENHQIESANTR